jgi:protein ImuB
LFETALRDPNRLGETLARLTGLLGAGRVGTPVLEETHRPDAFQMVSFTWQLDDRSSEVGTIDPNCPEREGRSRAALRRFRPASSASVLLEEDKPVHLRSREINGAAVAREGPYLASGNWWDDQGWTRREWDLYLSNGAVLRCHESAAGWQVDGIYD